MQTLSFSYIEYAQPTSNVKLSIKKKPTIARNLYIEKRIRSRRREGCNPYGGMGTDADTPEERREKSEELAYMDHWDVD